MALDKDQLIDIYRKRSKRYDFTSNLFYLLGFPVYRYRRLAVSALGLEPGHTIVDICCGTGLNFPLLLDKIGTGGRIIGVDLSDAMLEKARHRVRKMGWSNVDLVQEDAARFKFPYPVNGIISTFALTLVPEFEEVIRRGADALAPGGQWVILELKMPPSPIRHLSPLVVPLLFRPFGSTLDLQHRHPWEAFERYLTGSSVTELFGGVAYIAQGAALQKSRSAPV